MHKICLTISLFHASTCFEHHVLIVRKSKLYYKASGIITPTGGRPMHRACMGWPPVGVMVPEAVWYNFDLLTMSTWCSKHVEAWNKFIVECASSWIITKINVPGLVVSAVFVCLHSLAYQRPAMRNKGYRKTSVLIKKSLFFVNVPSLFKF